jgi:diaminopimelate epimerase
MNRPFLKMNGAGNDFVVVEARSLPFAPEPALIRAIADRAGPSGCDQLIAIEPSAKADAFMRIWNSDGGQVDACGNATRCVGWLLLEQNQADTAVIETNVGLIAVERDGGELLIEWREADNHVLMTGPVAFEFTGSLDDGAPAPQDSAA